MFITTFAAGRTAAKTLTASLSRLDESRVHVRFRECLILCHGGAPQWPYPASEPVANQFAPAKRTALLAYLRTAFITASTSIVSIAPLGRSTVTFAP
jgi:hypothetical protein